MVLSSSISSPSLFNISSRFFYFFLEEKRENILSLHSYIYASTPPLHLWNEESIGNHTRNHLQSSIDVGCFLLKNFLISLQITNLFISRTKTRFFLPLSLIHSYEWADLPFASWETRNPPRIAGWARRILVVVYWYHDPTNSHSHWSHFVTSPIRESLPQYTFSIWVFLFHIIISNQHCCKSSKYTHINTIFFVFGFKTRQSFLQLFYFVPLIVQ